MTYTLNNKQVLVVDVPKGSRGYYTANEGTRLYYQFNVNGNHYTTLPPGSWSILGLGSELTEEQAKGLVVVINFKGIKCYTNYAFANSLTDTALSSFHSWLHSIGKEPETSLVLINEKN